jgi:hypothetical protein
MGVLVLVVIFNVEISRLSSRLRVLLRETSVLSSTPHAEVREGREGALQGIIPTFAHSRVETGVPVPTRDKSF